MRTYGYNDTTLVQQRRWTFWRGVAAVLAVLLIVGFWFALNQKLLFGGQWMSETYDNEDWRTNEGNLHTYGAWDLEAHVWKSQHIIENFPNHDWNPYWYLGMPLIKYYPSGFYVVNWLVMLLTGFTAARAALMLIIFSHLLAALLTALLCYKVSKRVWVSALAATFVLSNTFISLRSYGWEPITIVFLFLFPLGLLLFLREPLRPLRFWLVLALGLAYITHPLLWFSLCMTMGVYLFSIAIRRTEEENAARKHYIWQYVVLVFASILIGAVQFVPQMSYEQVTSGAHMGIKYLPFYQVPPNIISLKDFLFDAGNLKGPGPIIMIALFLILVFAFIDWRDWRKGEKKGAGSRRRGGIGDPERSGQDSPRRIDERTFSRHELAAGLALVLLVMVLFYYIELYNIFPMNLLRSIQYHRIIPEFIIVAATLVAALSNIAHTRAHKRIYYAMLVGFVIASSIVIFNVQEKWATTDDISEKQEFIYDDVKGRISMPYTDQSLSVRNSFTEIPQVYGYYEQGITNSYNDEVFSVSSGYHNAELTMLYLQAANVGRLYANTEEGERDRIVQARLNTTLDFVHEEGDRYGYFEIPLADPSFAQAVDGRRAAQVEELEPGCRVMFVDEYCGSVGEEFVGTDPKEVAYLKAYVALLDAEYGPEASMDMEDPDHYRISVKDADAETAIVVKMTYDEDFHAYVGGNEAVIEKFGPDFMLIKPGRSGDYMVLLEYEVSAPIRLGAVISVMGTGLIALLFLFKRRVAALLARASKRRSGSMEVRA